MILIKRTAQSLARLEQAITSTLAYVLPGRDASLVSLPDKVKMLREEAGDVGGYDPGEDDWRPLLDRFELNVMYISEIWAPEVASPGCTSLAELAELRFSFVSSYAHTFEYMGQRYPDYVAPALVPENTFAELCAELGVPPINLPSAVQGPPGEFEQTP